MTEWLVWLQVAVDSTIPLWGIAGGAAAAVAAVAGVTRQMRSHEKTDDARFAAVDAMLQEIRGDVKTLLARHSE